MFIDTHTHIYTTEFDEDREEVIGRAVSAGAQCLLLPNIDEASIDQMMSLYQQHPDLCRPMMGLHPTELPENPAPLLERMECMLQEENHPYVAIGEVGIDLYWDHSRCKEQIEVLKRQAEWAVRYQLPLVIHSRSAHRELVDTLLPFSQNTGGIFHCFGGTADEARELLDAFPNFMLGIGGVLTLKIDLAGCAAYASSLKPNCGGNGCSLPCSDSSSRQTQRTCFHSAGYRKTG